MGESSVKVRRAEARDMAFIIELWKKLSEEMTACDERYALRQDAEILWAKWAGTRLRDEDSLMLVAESGGDYIGYLLGHVDDAQPIFKLRRHATLTDVFVAKEHRRKGLGKRLVEEAVAFFKERGVSNARANVLSKNPGAKAFLEKMGFGSFLERMWKPL